MLNRILASGIVLGVMLLCALTGAIVAHTTPLLSDLRTSCAVGIVGSSASVTVTGLLAGRTCRELLHGQSQKTYERSATPAEPVVCEYQYGRQRLIVRDEGILKLVGNAVCDQLRQTSS